MSEKNYTLKFFVNNYDVASGLLTYAKDAPPPASAPISGITMPDDSHLTGDLAVNGETYRISVVVTKKNVKAKELKVSTTVPDKPFKMNDKSFERILIRA
jgi:hypothetical protein